MHGKASPSASESQLLIGRYRFVVVAQDHALIDNRKTYFPNLELAISFYNNDPSDETIWSGHLFVVKAITRERLAQFLRLPIHWDRDGSRESLKIRCYRTRG
jgi:hypothetical protein